MFSGRDLTCEIESGLCSGCLCPDQPLPLFSAPVHGNAGTVSGHALMEADMEEKHLQAFGYVHGGVFASIVDTAAFWAVFCKLDENVGITSVDLKLNYLAPVQKGKLIARGRCIKLGKTLGLGKRRLPAVKASSLHRGRQP